MRAVGPPPVSWNRRGSRSARSTFAVRAGPPKRARSELSRLGTSLAIPSEVRVAFVRLVLAASLASAGCSGVISDPPGSGEPRPTDMLPRAGDPSACEPAALPARVWRLTDTQYANAIRDLLPVDEVPDVRTPGTTNHDFVSPAELLRVDGALAFQYQAAAEQLAAVAAERLDAWLPCDAASEGDAACGAALIDRWVSRAYRRPLSADERADLLGLFEVGAEEGLAGGVSLVVEAVLQAPSFLYRTELGAGTEEEALDLTSHELASQLAFFLIGSIPDEPLWAAAEDGSLLDDAVYEAHVDRLLATERVQRNLDRTVLAWLGTERVLVADKDPDAYPELDADLRRSMYRETERFLHEVLWGDTLSGDLRALLTSTETWVDGPLAAHYGLEGISGDTPVPVTLPRDERAGILTHASLLTALSGAAETSVVHRGLFVRKALLCQTLPAPPDGVDLGDEDTAALSEREFAAQRADNTACRGCHQLIDPVGLVFEHYDPIGRFRLEDHGAAVDATGALSHTRDADGELDGAIELAERLAGSNQVSQCIAGQMLSHAFGRPLGEDDACALGQVNERFEGSGQQLREVFRAIALLDEWRSRSVGGEP